MNAQQVPATSTKYLFPKLFLVALSLWLGLVATVVLVFSAAQAAVPAMEAITEQVAFPVRETRAPQITAQASPSQPYLVKDININAVSSSPSELTAAGGTLFFKADDGTHGEELWISDGTSSGTVLVKDIYSGTSSSSPSHLTTTGGKLFFQADDGSHGAELWALAVGQDVMRHVYLPVVYRSESLAGQ